MSTAFKKFRKNLTKTAILLSVGVVTYTGVNGADLNPTEELEINSGEVETGEIIQDKVDLNKNIDVAKAIFYKKDNELEIEWNNVDGASEYKIYKIKDINSKDLLEKENLILVGETQETNIKLKNIKTSGSPDINVESQTASEIDISVVLEETEKEYSLYVEALDSEEAVLAKSELTKVDLADKLIGYSYKISYDKEEILNSNVNIKKDEKISIKLSNKNKYLHIKGVYESGVSSNVTTYEIPLKSKTSSGGKVKLKARVDSYKHTFTEGASSDVGTINVLATSKEGFKEIINPDGTSTKFGSSKLEVVKGDMDDNYKGVKATSDGGYIVVGESSSKSIKDNLNDDKEYNVKNKGKKDAIIVKYSKDNKIEMVSSYGSGVDDVFYDVIEVKDNKNVVGYAAVGNIDKKETVVMFNSDGKYKWHDVIDTASSQVQNKNISIMQNSKGELIVSGYETKANNPQISVYNFNSSAEKVITMKIENEDEEIRKQEIKNIHEGEDGSYYAVGSVSVYDNELKKYVDKRAVLTKYDKDFKQQWSSTYGGDYDVNKSISFNKLLVSLNGDIVVIGNGDVLKSKDTGEVNEDSMGGKDFFIVRYNSKNGEIKWQNRFGGSSDDEVYDISELDNGDLVTTGYTKSKDGDFLKLKGLGSSAFVMTHSGVTGERIGEIMKVGDNDTIATSTDILNNGVMVTVGNQESKDTNKAFISNTLGSTSTSILYDVNESGEYEFEFIDVNGKSKTYLVKVGSNNHKKSPSAKSSILTEYSLSNGRVTDLNGNKVSSVYERDKYQYRFNVNNITGEPFIEVFGGTKPDHIYKTIEHNGDYISVGYTESNSYDFSSVPYSYGPKEAFIVRHDNKGNLIKLKTFGGNQEDIFMDIQLVNDGYVIAGYGNSTNGDLYTGRVSNMDGFVLKVDFNFNKKWVTSIYGVNWDVFNGLTVRDDGGVVAVGSTSSHPGWVQGGSDGTDVQVSYISATGKLERTLRFGGVANDYGQEIINNGDGTYTLIGQSYSVNGFGMHKGDRDGILVKLDGSGNILKKLNFGGSGDDLFRDVYRFDNGDFVVVGYTQSYNKDLAGVKYSSDRDGLIILYDKNWNVKWKKLLAGTGGNGAEWLLAVYGDETGIVTSGFGGSTNGDFAGLNRGGDDAIVARFNLKTGQKEWVRNFGGSGEERLRTMVRTPEGGYIIGGDTTSRNYDLSGVTIRGNQDALLVKFNPDGTLGVYPSDTEIDSISYKVESDILGVRNTVLQGVIKNETVGLGQTKSKTFDFTVPRASTGDMLVTVQLSDTNDSSSSNNKITTRVPIIDVVDTDYSFNGYNVISTKDSKLQGTLRKNQEYKLNLNIKSGLVGGAYSQRKGETNKEKNTKSSVSTTVEKVKYKIVSTNGTVNKDLNKVTLSNVQGTVLAQGEFSNVVIPEESAVWKNVTFKTLNNEDMSDVVMVAEIISSDDADTSNNRLVVRLPIINSIQPDLTIKNVEIYPNGIDNGSLILGNEANIKVTLNSNTIKTTNADVTLNITDGKKVVELNKKAFGVSQEYPGVVYFKYKPENIGKLTFVAKAKSEYGNKVSNQYHAHVSGTGGANKYDSANEKTGRTYDITSEVVTYLKVEKKDHDTIKLKECVDKSNCQTTTAGEKVCPKHEYYDWSEWYDAYVPVKTTKLSAFEEKYNVKSVLFKSKETEELAKKGDKNVTSDGEVELMDSKKAKNATVKAGYGFDLKVETEYENNLPKIFKEAKVTNIAPANTSWSQYRVISSSSSSIPFIYYSEGLEGVDGRITAEKGAISFTQPAIDDIIIENPNQLYLKMPNKDYLIVDEGEDYASNILPKLKLSEGSEKKVVGDKYYEKKVIELKRDEENSDLGKRGYYINENTANGTYYISIFNRYSGYGPTATNKLHVKEELPIKVQGGMTDDVVDMP